MQRDVRKIWLAIKRHWYLAWPLILANIATPLLALSDVAIAGHLTEAKYLASVTIGAELITFIFWIFGFFRMGTTGLISQAAGEKNELKKAQIFSNSILMALVTGIIVAVIALFLKTIFVQSLSENSKLNDLIETYFSIRLLATPAVLMTYVIYGWLIGNSHTKIAVILTFTVNMLNILLNIYFAIFLELNSNGIALGTLIAEWFGLFFGLSCIIYITKKNPLKSLYDFNKRTLIVLARINGPLFLRTIVLKIVFVSFTLESIKLGIDLAAAIGVFLIILSSVAHCIDGFSFASEIEAGNSIGSMSFENFIYSLWAGAIWTFVSIIFFNILLLSFGSSLINLLTSHSKVANSAISLIPILCLFLVVAAPSYWLDGVFIGLTRVKDMCLTVILATLIGWYGSMFLVGTETLNGLLFTFFSFGTLRTVLLFLRLKTAIKSFKHRFSSHLNL